MTYIKQTLILLLLIPSSLSHAQTPGAGSRGFAPPSVPFSGKGSSRDDLFDDDEFFDDDEDDISDEIIRNRMEQRLKEKANATPSGPKKGGVDIGQAASSIGATTMSGGANSKIIPGAQSKGCLKLNPETGYGPDIITNFDFPDADIMEIAKTLGRLTCINFIIDKEVKGRISIVSNSNITVGDAWKAFLTALDVNGFSIIPSGKYMRIARHRDVKDKQIKTYSGDYAPDSDVYITRIIPMKYIQAEEVRRVFSSFMPPNTRMASYEQTNTLIITDTGANIKRITDMIKLLDVEVFDEKLEVIRIRHASANDIAKLIDQLMPGQGGSTSPGVPRFRGGYSVRRTKEGGVISNIIPDDRTNAVIVSANAKGLEQVKELIKKLDAKVSASTGGSKIHVVYLQFADAEQVAQTLNNLASGSGAKPTPISSSGTGGASAQLFEGAIKIAADKPTNSLVITGTPSDFQTIARVIAKLDISRDQVYVEAIIMEVLMDKTFDLGTSIALPNSGIGFQPDSGVNSTFGQFLQNPLALSGLVMGFKHGQTTTLPGPGGTSITVSSIQGLIRALQSNTNGNVIATPQIMTLDNQDANIEISENVPIPQVTALQGVSQQSFIREKVALSLKIKPQINKISNFVKLDIDQKLEDFSNKTPPAEVAKFAIGTQSRASKTTVLVQDGDTVVLGGLVRDKTEEKQIKVPLLGDIPLLGWLFRSKTTVSNKQNLLVFVTPQIIKQYQTVRKILDKKIRERDEFIEKNAGGEDKHEDYKLGIIKNLPPVESLKNGARVENSEINPRDEEEENDEEEEIPPHSRLEKQAAEALRATPPAPVPQQPDLQQLSKPVPSTKTEASPPLVQPELPAIVTPPAEAPPVVPTPNTGGT